jgi:hypothetical protein
MYAMPRPAHAMPVHKSKETIAANFAQPGTRSMARSTSAVLS